MFTNKRDKQKEEQFIDKELELYRKEKKLNIDKELEDYRYQMQYKVQDIAERCAKELGEYEHEYHYTKEIKGIELAKLEAKVELANEKLDLIEQVKNSQSALIENYIAQIKSLDNIISALINKKQDVIIQQIKQ